MSADHDSYDKQYIAAHAEVHTPAITLDDEVAQFGVLQHEKTDLWEETAFALVAQCGDHDVLMWTAGYLLKSHGRGVWIDKQAAEHDSRGINGVKRVDNRLELRSAPAIKVVHP